MNLTIFQSDKGDCLMLTSDNKRMLIDGGMRESYTRHVAPTLKKLRDDRKKIDLIYVSHIDRDHVFGILQMLEDLVAWRVFDFHQSARNGNRNHPRPKVKRPPEIGGIWQNVFHELVGKNAGPIGDMLAASAQSLSGTDNAELTELLGVYQNLTSSMTDAVELSRRAGPKQLKIPINKDFGGKLILCDPSRQPVRFGNAKVHVIGPSKSDLTKLRKEWNKWLKSEKGQRQIRKVRHRHRPDEDSLDFTNLAEFLSLRRSRADELGRRSKVTLPNLASLMLLVEEDGKTVLLTGDGHWEDILSGLEKTGSLAPGAGLHVNVLKVQHHGSEHNTKLDFCKRITADHYVFCGNGAHENPDLQVVDVIARSRIGPSRERSSNPEARNACTFWFNTSSTYRFGKAANLAHMKEVEKKMKHLNNHSNGQIRSKFLKQDRFAIDI